MNKAITKVFDFFSKAENLDLLTPKWLRFEIVTPLPIEMKTGALIDYRLRLHGIRIRWRTQIALWDPPFRFVDAQVKGSYKLWIHEHSFEEKNGGTIVHES